MGSSVSISLESRNQERFSVDLLNICWNTIVWYSVNEQCTKFVTYIHTYIHTHIHTCLYRYLYIYISMSIWYTIMCIYIYREREKAIQFHMAWHKDDAHLQCWISKFSSRIAYVLLWDYLKLTSNGLESIKNGISSFNSMKIARSRGLRLPYCRTNRCCNLPVSVAAKVKDPVLQNEAPITGTVCRCVGFFKF